MKCFCFSLVTSIHWCVCVFSGGVNPAALWFVLTELLSLLRQTSQPHGECRRHRVHISDQGKNTFLFNACRGWSERWSPLTHSSVCRRPIDFWSISLWIQLLQLTLNHISLADECSCWWCVPLVSHVPGCKFTVNPSSVCSSLITKKPNLVLVVTV